MLPLVEYLEHARTHIYIHTHPPTHTDLEDKVLLEVREVIVLNDGRVFVVVDVVKFSDQVHQLVVPLVEFLHTGVIHNLPVPRVLELERERESVCVCVCVGGIL